MMMALLMEFREFGFATANADLFTSVLFDNASAGVAFHMAAPVKFAIASLFDHNFFRIVTTTAAKNCTPI